MKKCSNECTPCCDFCIHAYHEYFEDKDEGYLNGFIRGGPIGCIIHYDEKHQQIAQSCGWCDDFYCFRQYKEDVQENCEETNNDKLGGTNMPLYKDRKCERCGKWDFVRLTSDKYICKECKRKEKEDKLEAIYKVCMGQ